jgi:hypothetical protein
VGEQLVELKGKDLGDTRRKKAELERIEGPDQAV